MRVCLIPETNGLDMVLRIDLINTKSEWVGFGTKGMMLIRCVATVCLVPKPNGSDLVLRMRRNLIGTKSERVGSGSNDALLERQLDVDSMCC